ncbi:MAG: transporter substrate-binding domain-containing protein, partial [Candidatus Omnitrophica bacterium]|nr:transporter substrate-binding domain-containing protein [Candidatus Omnitrophota bacterium]
MKKTFILSHTFTFLLILFSLASAAWSVEPAEETGLMFVGDEELAPYSFFSRKVVEGVNTQDEFISVTIFDNVPRGYCIDLIKKLSAVINKKISIELVSPEKFASFINSSEPNNITALIPDQANRQFFDFSRPIAKIEFAIFAEVSNSYINSLESLEGMVVAIHKESPILGMLSQNKKITVIETSSVLEALKKLSHREVAAVIAEKNITMYYIQQNKIENLKIVGAPVGPFYSYTFAVKRGDTALLDRLNSGLQILEQ